MFLTIADILSRQQLQETLAIADRLIWRDGANTAGPTARSVKRNEQADLTTGEGLALHRHLMTALERSDVLTSAARPKSFSKLILSRTTQGGGYGPHIDNALIGRRHKRLRTDLSFTLFLSEPDTYDGGELEIDLPGQQLAAKPPAGHLVLYPSTSLHQVRPVTRGLRLACVGWIQSLVPDPAKREILFDLDNVRTQLGRTLSSDAPERLVLDKTQANLLRLWMQP